MRKEYVAWTSVKKTLNNTGYQKPYFKERQIWHCHIGENIGFEQDGRGDSFLRPVIILRKFNNDVFWGIPLTRTLKDLSFYFAFNMTHTNSESTRKSSAILSQIRLTDAYRLADHIGYISKEDFQELKKRFKALLP